MYKYYMNPGKPAFGTCTSYAGNYIENKKAKYTNAKPVSFCKMENTTGKKQMPAAMRCAFVLVKSVPG